MPIRQPLKTTIHTNDFRDHTFSFPVESVLPPQQGSGQLIISASAGYLLTTSPDHEPTPEQTLDHVLQPDGNRVARGTVTLLANDEPMEESTITIRNPSGETVILTVDATPELGLVTNSPQLRVNTHELTFAKTPVGKPTFLVLTIAQQNAHTPVTITTDAPDTFQLASDSRPAFAPSLTLCPSPTGTYVHVRFGPVKAGRTEAFLFIETPYTRQVVTLTGRGIGLLPTVRTAPAVRAPQPDQPSRPVSGWLGLLLTTLLVVGLSAVAYTFRCQLIPSLCEEVAKPSVTQQRSQPTVLRPAPTVEAVPPKHEEPVSNAAKPERADRRGDERPTRQSTDNGRDASKPIDQLPDPAPRTPVSGNAEEQTGSATVSNLPTTSSPKTVVRQPESPQKKSSKGPKAANQPEPVAPATAESELEQELNAKKPKNQ